MRTNDAEAAPSGGVAVSDEVVSAAERGEEEAVLAWLDSGGRADATYERDSASGLTLLMTAANYGHERVVELLLQHGAEINLQSSNGYTALMYAANQRHEPVVELLIRHGAEVNLKDSDGGTALMDAAVRGHEQLVDLLLRRGAEINLRDRNGWTALMVAALFGHPAVVRCLLRAGADTAARSANGNTALQLAKEKGHAECVEAFKKHVQEVGLPVSSSGVAVGRRVSAETQRRVTVIVEQAHARGGDGQPCLELLAAGLAGAAWKIALAIGTAVAAFATTCVLVLCVIEVTPPDWWVGWFGPGDDASSAPIHSAEDFFAAFGCAIASIIVAAFKVAVLLLVLFLALSGPSIALQACAFRWIAWWPHAMAVLGAACIAVACVYIIEEENPLSHG